MIIFPFSRWNDYAASAVKLNDDVLQRIDVIIYGMEVKQLGIWIVFPSVIESLSGFLLGFSFGREAFEFREERRMVRLLYGCGRRGGDIFGA